MRDGNPTNPDTNGREKTDFDTTVKILTRENVPKFYELLEVSPFISLVQTEFESPFKGRIDHLSKHQGNTYVHIEFQTQTKYTMHWRMLDYYCMIGRYTNIRKEKSKLKLKQYVIYIGNGNHGMVNFIENDNLKFEYSIVRAVDIDKGGVLLKSENFHEKLLGLICHPALFDRHWETILRELAHERQKDKRKARDLCVLLAVVAVLRNAKSSFGRLIRNFGMDIDVRESPLLKELSEDFFEKGAVSAAREYLTKLVQNTIHRMLNKDEEALIESLDKDTAAETFNQVLSGQPWDGIYKKLRANRFGYGHN